MTRPPTILTRAPLVAACLLAALVGCTPKDRAAPADTVVVVRPARAINPQLAARLPGALAKPIAQYTPDEFFAFARTLTFAGGAERQRKCKDAPACSGKHPALTSARIDGVVGQDSIDMTSVPTNGVIALQTRNTGRYTEARYGLLPGPYQYYVVVLPDTAGTASWRLQRVDTTARARTLVQVATGVVQPCSSHPFARLTYHANFYSCDTSHAAGDTVMRMPLRLQGGDDGLLTFDPMWMSCKQGCCTVI